MSLTKEFIPSILKRFESCKELGDKTFNQLEEKDFVYEPSPESNSIAIIIQHFCGNALSRFTGFLTLDGEKAWRNRDLEFETRDYKKQDLLTFWETGWNQVFGSIENLTEEDLSKTIYIRSEPILVFDALLRQLGHYCYHVGQIVYIGKMIKNETFESLSIPKHESKQFNQAMKHL